MPRSDASRIEVEERRYTYTSRFLDDVLGKIDSRTTFADIWMVITRTSGLISKTEYYSDAAKTQKILQREFTRTLGTDNINRVTGVTTTFYNSDGSTDSQVTTVMSRTTNLITEDENPFSTSEVIPCP